MPRKPAEACMFCETSPCSCPGQAVTTRRRKLATAVDVELPKESEDIFGDIPVAPESPFKKAKQSDQERDLTLMSALRAVREICDEPSQRKIDQILNPPYSQELDRRVEEWKGTHVR